MSVSNFEFLKQEYPSIATLGVLAERSLYSDPSNTLLKLRIISEKITLYILEYEGIDSSEAKDQMARLRILFDDELAPAEIIEIFHSVRKSGNNAAHSGQGTLPEARFMLKRMFHLCCWL